MSATKVEQSESGAIPISPSLTMPGGPEELEHEARPVGRRVLYLSIQAIINAIIIGFVAKILVGLIYLITNIAFYGKVSFTNNGPAGNHLGWVVILVPIVGGIIVGIMARFGSAAIRGHGIPEAMEQVLTNESKIKPIVTFLKPISAAIAIGTGGPFGAEGPIIATGGAFGSLTGQIMKITSSERKIMLAAGACAGMAAIFGCPLAAVLLAIELLLFEFSPRSIIPVALSCATGAAAHFALFGSESVFAMPTIPAPTSLAITVYVVLGAIIGVAAALVSKGVYLVEDLFEKLPIHWMWWPAIGAVAVGVVGYFAPRTLGVGYSNISDLLTGNVPLQVLLMLCFMKFLSWVISLGSGTSGGTLAPLLTIGGALGGLLGIGTLAIFPHSEINVMTCVLIGMAAMFAGASRALLTSIVFALETTMQPHGLLPLLGACTAAYFISFFLMKGTIMTEKIERRGVFAPHSYEPDVLQSVTVKEVCEDEGKVLDEDYTIGEAREWIKSHAVEQGQTTAFIVADKAGKYKGVVKRSLIFNKQYNDTTAVSALIGNNAPYIYEYNRLSIAVDIMDRYDTDVLPVVTHDKDKKIIGLLSHKAIFTAYRKHRNDEHVYKQEISLRPRSISILMRGNNS